MGAVWLVVRAGLRSHWRPWLTLAVMVALVGGLVMAVAAGARRSDAAYPALVAWSAPPDDLLNLAPSATFARMPAARVRSLPQVAAAGEFDGFGVLFPASVNLVAPVDGTIPGALWHRKLLAGALPDPGRADEADISFTVAQTGHLTVGGTLRVTLLAAGDKPVPFAFKVTGIDAAPGEFPPQYGTGYDFVWATPAFARQFAARLPTVAGLAVRLRGGAAAVPALERELSLRGDGKPVSDFPLAIQAANTEHTIHLQAVVLWLLTGALALLGLIVLSQLLSRLTALESAGLAGLRAIGMSPVQLAAAGLLRVAATSACGALLALPLAFAISPLFPVGLAATAEPRPGFDADWLVFALGAVSVVVAVTGCAAWPAWRSARAALPTAARAAAGLPRPHAGVSSLVRSFRPISAAAGVRLALYRGSGQSAVPVASTVTASIVGVLGLTAALVFSASLGSLLATPRHYGTAWDAFVSDVSYPGSLAPAASSVAADAAVARWTGSYGPIALDIGGVQVGAMTTGPGPDGILAATPLRGAQPESATDIVLGQRTLAALRARIGDTVTVAVVGLPRRVAMRVVGTAVFPAFGDTTQLGTGAEITVAGLDGLKPPSVQLPPFGWLLVTFKAGTSPAAGLSALSARLARLGPFAVAAPSTPADLVNFGQLEDLPLLIGLSLSALALLTVAHLLFTSVRRRRRDFAVLRVLGFTGRQVRATVSWMAVTVAVVALALGVPLGIVAGRLAWLFFAGQLGIQPAIVLAPAPLAGLAAAGILLAVAVAAVPGAAAGRARPAVVLRTE
jgi:hypothetical protein